MSLWDAEPVPSRVIGLIHTALMMDSIGITLSRSELELWMSPEGYYDPKKLVKFNETFAECKQLGLLTISEDRNTVLVNKKFTSAINHLSKSDISGLQGLSVITEMVRKHVNVYLAQNPTPDSAFCRLLAWALMQNGRNLPLTIQSAEKLCNEQDPERKHVNFNSERYGAFRFWAVFLGFGWQQSIGSAEALQPDPTIAFEYAISRWIVDDIDITSSIPVSEFLTKMAQYYPWIEDGLVAKRLRRDLNNAPVQSGKLVNDTTSLALSRLEKKGFVRLRYISDAANVYTLSWGGARREISHIELNKDRITS